MDVAEMNKSLTLIKHFLCHKYCPQNQYANFTYRNSVCTVLCEMNHIWHGNRIIFFPTASCLATHALRYSVDECIESHTHARP